MPFLNWHFKDRSEFNRITGTSVTSFMASKSQVINESLVILSPSYFRSQILLKLVV